MAEVHFAIRREEMQRVFAIKRILPQHAADPSFRRFFSAEIELSKSLHHPAVVETIDHGEVDRSPFLAMEYIHGRALNRLLYALGAQGRRLPVPFAVYIAMKALDGLDYIHHARDPEGRRIDAVICDISPSNIMVGYDGSIKLIDFGIATSRLRFFEQIGMLKGKKNYMSPEQLRGLPLDHRADIFAMGLCLFELITAQAVFSGKSDFEVEEAVRSGKLPQLSERAPNLPAGLEEVVHRAVALSPDERYSSAGDFARALEPYAKLGKGNAVGPKELAKVLPVYIAS
ncbi:MAG TPA: serine/threonine-protein kinase, partial [Myxococcaceae bacterium]|nr:serine/threonine-protein kinase [Myxococcaceae bacterium]